MSDRHDQATNGSTITAPPILCARCGGAAALVRRWSPDPERVAARPTCVDCWARAIVSKPRGGPT